MTSLEDAPRATYRDVLAEPRFRVLFGARCLWIAGSVLRTVGLSVLVYGRTGSPLLAGLAFGASWLPQVAGGLLLGALADRLRPRPLVVGAYAAGAAATAVPALPGTPVAVSLLLVAAVSVVTPVVSGAFNRLISEVLSGDAYVLGRSLTLIAASAAQVLGLAFGGIVIAALGARSALLVATAAFVLAAALTRARLPDLPAAPRAEGMPGSVLRESWSGSRDLLADPVVRALLLAQWLPLVFASGAEGLLVPYAAVRGFPEGAGALLLACSPAGMLVGNLAAGRGLGPRARERMVVPLLVLLGLPLLGPALPVPLAVLVVLQFAAGAGYAYELGIQRRFVDAVPDGARGHAFGLASTGMMTFQGLGPVLSGAVAEFLPVGWTIALCGAAIVLTALLLRGGLARARRLDDRQDDRQGDRRNGRQGDRR
jgi:predicted MFS family arabinose efflux permease